MRIYSDILTDSDLLNSVHGEEYLIVGIEKMRKTSVRERGWTIYLQDRDAGKPTSWDQTGEWIAKLFAIDPNAKVNLWDSAEMFAKGARYRSGPNKGKPFLSPSHA